MPHPNGNPLTPRRAIIATDGSEHARAATAVADPPEDPPGTKGIFSRLRRFHELTTGL